MMKMSIKCLWVINVWFYFNKDKGYINNPLSLLDSFICGDDNEQ